MGDNKVSTMNDLGRSTWAEVDLNRLTDNLKEFRGVLPDHVRIMAVIKADGYGHGAYEVARAALREGAFMLGVASLEEGVELRRKGISAPVLVLGYTDPGKSGALIEFDLTPTIFHWETALAIAEKARSEGKSLPVHVKVDTGMGRIGLRTPAEVISFLERLSALEGIRIEGLFTHFATADEPEDEPENENENKDSFMQEQLRKFTEICREAENKGMHIPLKHAANSAAAIAYPQSHLDMVRIGIGMYGYYPSREIRLFPSKNLSQRISPDDNQPSEGLSGEKVKLTPVLSLKTKIIFLKKIAPGTPVSYGRTFTAQKETLVATVPLGYGDGYSRQFSNNGVMLVRGREAPVVGRVCMDMTMLDVGGIPGVSEGDEVVVYGKQHDREITVEQAAHRLGTISYELLCNISSRIPRVYVKLRT